MQLEFKGFMEKTIKILHLEDNHNDSLLVQTVFKKSNINFEYFFADNEEDFIAFLQNQKIDLILSDYQLPDYSGSVALLYAKTNCPEIPFVFLSGTMGEDAAIESLVNGATDYVLKSNMERLLSAVQKAIQWSKDQQSKKLVENELRKLSRAVEQSPNSIIITDTRGIIEYANPIVYKLTGYKNEDIIGKTPSIFSSGEKSKGEYAALWKTISSGKDWKGEFHNKKKNGELFWESANISPIKDEKGNITNYVGIKEDITESKKLTLELIKAKEKAEESDRLKTAFLHNISHEIRTPMNAIVGFSEFLNNPGLASQKRKQFTDIIIQSSNQLLSIITDIVDIATIEAGQEKIVESEMNLNSTLELIHHQFQIKAEKQNVKLIVKLALPDNEDRIITDESKLIQIITNLIDNGLKFTKQGHVSFGYKVSGNELEFSVTDTGIGIPSEMKEAIFNRFSQVESTIDRQYGGSGLGLSISKAYTEFLGGRMWVKSEIGQGSTFYFTIPFKKVKKETIRQNPTLSNSSIGIGKQKTILIAEDENSNYLLLKDPLSDYKFKIVRAYNGVEAIEICELIQVDLILMDIKMPVMDGYEATKRIRTFKPDIPIIAVTAYTNDMDKQKALLCGCNDFISKPINQKVLLSKIKTLLDVE